MKTQLQVYAVKDSKGNTEKYLLRTWDGPDGAMQEKEYSLADGEALFSKIFDGTKYSLPKDPSRVFVYFGDNGLIESVNAQVTGDFKEVIVKPEVLDKEVSIQATNVAVSIGLVEEKKAVPVQVDPIDDTEV